MVAILLLVIFSLGVAFFATQNTGLVHIMLGSYLIPQIPLYVLVIGSLLLGIFISWLISLVDTFSNVFAMHGKESEIKDMHKTIDSLKKENHELEIENTHLKDKLEIPHHEEHTDEKRHPFQGIRQALS